MHSQLNNFIIQFIRSFFAAIFFFFWSVSMVLLGLERKIFLSFGTFFLLSAQKYRSYFTFFFLWLVCFSFFGWFFFFHECTTQINCISLEPFGRCRSINSYHFIRNESFEKWNEKKATKIDDVKKTTKRNVKPLAKNVQRRLTVKVFWMRRQWFETTRNGQWMQCDWCDCVAVAGWVRA